MNESEPNPNMEKKCPQCGAVLPSGALEGLCPACLLKQGAAADTAMPGEPAPSPFQPPTVEEVAQLFPQLQILAFIGKGGMGAVYKARQPGLDRVVALKILPPQTAGGPGFVERFNREARALAKLSHPNIVAVYEFGQVNGLPFFIMEFVDGLNLRQLEQAGKLSPREALQIVPQICEALQFAHDEGIVHRDIKPENILLDKKGRVRIADFGIAKILGREPDLDLTQTKDAIGTPHYMAPEQMEKPTTVDHRADIFSLGVVFYEMLTGELPLGKFAPPSSRKVEVDVRLDDVVLRALEKDPDRRYQKVSQVKTAVDTIAGSAPPPPSASGEAIAREIFAQDYNLGIRSCVRRGWKLLRGDFWPFVGITALVMALVGFVSAIGGTTVRRSAMGDNTAEFGSAFSLLVWGPLMGGLCLYYLKKIRGEKTTVEIAFCGFSHRFLHLFLAGFATTLLTWLGFLCFALPGIYLCVAWMFTLPLVIDKGLDFWSAMELSRKVVTKHWFKLFGLGLVLLLLMFAGVVMLFVGLLVMMPLVAATLMYAYEDIFCSTAAAGAVPPVVGTGPAGTVVMPATSAGPPRGIGWGMPAMIGLGAVILLVALFFAVTFRRHHSPFSIFARRPNMENGEEFNPPVAPEPLTNNPVPMTGDNPAGIPAEPSAAAPQAEAVDPNATFGPVIERELQARWAGTNQFLNLVTGQLLTPPSDVTNVLTGSPQERDLFWRGLAIPADSSRFRYISWLRESGADLMFDGNGQIIGFDSIFALAHGDSSTNWDNWDSLTPAQVQSAAAVIDWTRRAAQAQSHGQPAPPVPSPGGTYNSASQLDSSATGGPVVNLLTRDQSVNWFFKTRSGGIGVLQLVSFTYNPPSAKIRYKLVQPSTNQDSPVSTAGNPSHREALDSRLEAASEINNITNKDRALAAIAIDAAKTGEMAIVQNALQQISNPVTKDQSAGEVARLLAKRGQRKQAVEIAKSIDNPVTKDQALSELAH
jgi:predicted Ser/Thr protein kinase